MTTKHERKPKNILNKSFGTASQRGMNQNDSMDFGIAQNDMSMLSVPGNEQRAVSYLANIPDAAELRHRRAQRAREKYNQLVKALLYNDSEAQAHEKKYKYENDFNPLVFFFKYLAKKPTDSSNSTWGRLKLWVPDTLVANDGENPTMWFYSSPEGYVYRTDNFTMSVIQNKFAGASPPQHELVAISKKPQYNGDLIGNDVHLISAGELSTFVGTFLTSRAGISSHSSSCSSLIRNEHTTEICEMPRT